MATTESRHTPGPWKLVKDERTNSSVQKQQLGYTTKSAAWIVHARNGVPVISRRGLARPTKSDGIANARLIASAPDLLAALRAIASHPTGGVGCNPQTFVQIARDAISKAGAAQ